MSERTTTEGDGTGREAAEVTDAGATPTDTSGVKDTSSVVQEKANGRAKLPLIAGAAAVAAVAGWVVLAGRTARKTVLGVRLPGGSRSPREALGDAVEDVGRVGRKATQLPAVKEVRARIGR